MSAAPSPLKNYLLIGPAAAVDRERGRGKQHGRCPASFGCRGPHPTGLGRSFSWSLAYTTMWGFECHSRGKWQRPGRSWPRSIELCQ